MSLIDILKRHIAYRRHPGQVIGGQDDPYLLRWFLLPRNPIFNVYLHYFLRSDDDRALHDHPWANLSILLEGEYTEHMETGKRLLRAGAWKLRLSGKYAHRIELHDGPCWTLFITGPRCRQWGFLCPQGWRHWRDSTASDDHGAVGKGCDQ